MKISKDKTKGVFGTASADRVMRYAYRGRPTAARETRLFSLFSWCGYRLRRKKSLTPRGVWRDSSLVLSATAENVVPNTLVGYMG